MASIRLNKELEQKIDLIAKQRKITRSEVIREAISEYVAEKEGAGNPYELGKELFGVRGSGESDRSVYYKAKLKSKLREKHTH